MPPCTAGVEVVNRGEIPHRQRRQVLPDRLECDQDPRVDVAPRQWSAIGVLIMVLLLDDGGDGPHLRSN